MVKAKRHVFPGPRLEAWPRTAVVKPQIDYAMLRRARVGIFRDLRQLHDDNKAWWYRHNQEYGGERVSKLTELLQAIDDRVAAYEKKRIALLDDQGNKLNDLGLESWRDQHAAAAKREAIIAESEGRIQAEARRLHADVEELRKQADEARLSDRSDTLKTYYDAVHTNDPYTSAQWAEAAARRDFVRADLERLPVGELMGYYFHADERGDTVGRFLAATVGREVLQSRLAKVKPLEAGHSELAEALHDLDAVTVGEATRRRDADLEEIDRLVAAINQPKTPTDQIALAEKYGIDPVATRMDMVTLPTEPTEPAQGFVSHEDA